MVERGIYDLSTWVAGMKYLPAAVELPDCFRVLQFEAIPEDRQEVDRQFKRLAKVAHPDAGGTEQQFRVLQAAREQALGWFDGGMIDV